MCVFLKNIGYAAKDDTMCIGGDMGVKCTNGPHVCEYVRYIEIHLIRRAHAT